MKLWGFCTGRDKFVLERESSTPTYRIVPAKAGQALQTAKNTYFMISYLRIKN